MHRLALVSFLVLSLVAVAGHAADASKPHPHRGVLKPYGRPPPVKLSANELSTLGEGKAVMRQFEGENGGRGLAVFRVNAAPDVVWATINDFGSYPKWISEVKTCEVYRKDGANTDVSFRISSLGVGLEYFVHHEYNHAEHWGTWTLDYNRLSDLDDSVGFWRVTPVEGNPAQSQVEYSVDISVKGWVPGFIRSLLVDRGLKQATEWVKVQSEKRNAQR